MELDGGEEGRGGGGEIGDGEENSGAAIGFGHDAFEGAVVGDTGVAELHSFEGELQAAASQGGFVGNVAVGFVVGYVQVEETHWRKEEEIIGDGDGGAAAEGFIFVPGGEEVYFCCIHPK